MHVICRYILTTYVHICRYILTMYTQLYILVRMHVRACGMCACANFHTEISAHLLVPCFTISEYMGIYGQGHIHTYPRNRVGGQSYTLAHVQNSLHNTAGL